MRSFLVAFAALLAGLFAGALLRDPPQAPQTAEIGGPRAESPERN